MATAIPQKLNLRRFTTEFATTNRLRTEGTRNLLDAVADAEGIRVVSQSVAFGYDPAPGLASEDAPLWEGPPASFAPALAALRDLERQTAAANGATLRFGHLYGPGTSFDFGGMLVEQVRAGKLPVVGGGHAVFSFTHTYDAASAVVAALDSGTAGTLNVVDDDPTPVHDWLPALAKLLGAPRPKRAPKLIARLLAGGWGLAYMTQLRGADNAQAKAALDWKPRFASWRDGFAEELGSS
jgi:nucleoside-diphosphate-sugar epimerase